MQIKTQVQDILDYIVLSIANPQKRISEFNYEDYAKEKYKEVGRGFVLIETSEYVNYCLSSIKDKPISFSYQYIAVNNDTSDIFTTPQKQTTKIREYNPLIQYVVIASVDQRKVLGLDGLSLSEYPMAGITANFSAPANTAPASITSVQIKKQLKRMIQQGKYLLILDTKHPDFMGANLALWLTEIEVLRKRGKQLTVIVESNAESPQTIPKQFSEKMINIESY